MSVGLYFFFFFFFLFFREGAGGLIPSFLRTEIERKKKREGNYQEMRKGSSKLLKTLMMRLSLVTQWMSGPGNWPLMSIPWRRRDENKEN